MSDLDFDVIFIGGGISGIGAARHLQEKCPDRSFALFEKMASHGGTWNTHRYPGVRSDSDLYTFGYKFKPWTGNPIAEGKDILAYLQETIEEGELERHIHYSHELLSASWSTDNQCWNLKILNHETNLTKEYSCNFLWMCNGYYRHENGYTPEFKGLNDFLGKIVHPQHWPEDLDYAGKSIIVIGSGATAATLVPNIADAAKHVTLLQRSPTYFLIAENRSELADIMRDLEVPEEWVHETVRRSLLKQTREFFDMALAEPEQTKQLLLDAIREYVGKDYDVEKHFAPRYRPGTQRVATIAGGDLFKKIAEGKVSVVTDEIDHFNGNGIMTKSGDQIDADIIITATGFDMSIAGDIKFDIDGTPINFGNEFTYHGVLISNVPNLLFMFGYLRTSWTMRVELLSEITCRLLNYMRDRGYSSCTPRLRESDKGMSQELFIAPSNFNPGYVNRSIHEFPRQGSALPWRFQADYYIEREVFPALDFEDDVLEFAGRVKG